MDLVTKGNGSAIHIARRYEGGGIATLCDAWGGNGAYGSRIRTTDAPAATCKSCLKKSAAS